MVRSRIPRHRLSICRRRPERKHGAQSHGPFAGHAGGRHRSLLCVRQRRWYLRTRSLHRRDAGRNGGRLARTAFPDHVASAGAYALVGMGTAFAGIVRVPMTSVIMIFEVTRDYTIIVPLMISNLISFFISRRLQPEPIYDALSRQDGIHLPRSGAHAARSTLRVMEAMPSETRAIEAEATIQEALDSIRSRPVSAWPVARSKQLLGLVSASNLESAAEDGAGYRLVSEILEPLPKDRLDAANFPHVHPDHPLDVALRRMGEMHLDVLPVVSRANVLEIVGIITLPDIMRA